jgi:hypothetical protein
MLTLLKPYGSRAERVRHAEFQALGLNSFNSLSTSLTTFNLSYPDSTLSLPLPYSAMAPKLSLYASLLDPDAKFESKPEEEDSASSKKQSLNAGRNLKS